MLIRSNIQTVINRLERLQSGIPDAVRQALDPAYWKARLEHVAMKTLRAQWALERSVPRRELFERLTPRIIATIAAEVFGVNGVRLSMFIPETSVGTLDVAAAAQYNLGQMTPAGREKKFAIHESAGEEHLQAVRQAIVDWVKLEKRRDERDAGLTDEQIADRIMEILGVSDRSVPRERTPAMDDAAAGLAQAIESWMAGEGDTPPTQPQVAAKVTIDQETAEQWLQVVLLAWTAFVRAHLPERIELELSKLNQRINTELL